ncbi:MAG TPA: LamG-like jellyroll fold domain-containing protein [Luteolibacter sp.]
MKPTSKIFPLVAAFTSCLAYAVEPTPTAAGPIAAEALSHVEASAIAFSAPAKNIPTAKMVDGPLLGNGDLGVTISGNPDALCFHIGKNDFWGQRTQSPMTVGQIQILAPALAGAPYKATCDLRRARWTGEFAKTTVGLSVRSFVDANANRLFITLANTGTSPLDIAVSQIKGEHAQSNVPTQVDAPTRPALVGCEQVGAPRWFFKGKTSQLAVLNRALSQDEIATLAKSPHHESQSFDGTRAEPLNAPAVSTALTVAGWILIDDYDAKEANYLVSTGEWSKSYSLDLSGGRLRLSINGTFVQTDEVLPKGKWIHVAGTFNGRGMTLYLDGKPAKSLGSEGSDGLSFVYAPDNGVPNARTVAVATRLLGVNGDRLTLAPNTKRTIVSAILSDLDAKDPGAKAANESAGMTQENAVECATAHEAWWAHFWSKSFIEIPDKVIEQHWYSSQYIIGSCSRAGNIAPGLWGNWITMDKTAWHGDFHLNYNFQAPFYSVFAANRPELALPFFDAMNQSIPRGQRIAKERGWKGIHLPVSIGPWGMCPEGDHSDWGQHSNAAYSALNYGNYWGATRDKAWLEKTGYPYMREVAAFWTDYLKFENGRYVIEHDAIHEGSGGAGRSGVSADLNPLFSLGVVRTLYRDMLDMSEALGVDAELRPKWKDILEKISPFPTQERGGKTVFRYTEKGTDWWPDNTVGIQHIYPAGAIGLDSDPKLLEISRNMIDAMNRWNDNNGSSSWYAACARVGYPPGKILSGMRSMYDKHSMPNKILYFGGGGIENVSPSAAINEMLMQSHEGVIRLFPCWPKDKDARFGTLRADGAFLVSAELKGGSVTNVVITSEKGGNCTVRNPWSDQQVRSDRAGGQIAQMKDGNLMFNTQAGETIRLSPETIR